MFIIDKKVIFVMIFLKKCFKIKNMTQEIANYSNILIELTKAVKMHNFYPDGHPSLDSALEKCYLLLKKRLEEDPEIKLQVDQKGFYSNKVTISHGNQDLAGLAKKLFFRRIKEISFTPRVTLGDMKLLLTAMKLEPEEIQALGGIETILAQKDVTGILLNSMRYEDLKNLKEELRVKQETETKNLLTKETNAFIPGESARNKEEETRQKQEEEEELGPLLERIKTETDILKYTDLSVRIKEKAQVILAEKKFEEVLAALLVFSEHSSSEELSEKIKTVAARNLSQLLNDEVVKFLVARAGNKDEVNRIEIQKMLLKAGNIAVETLLDAIIEAHEAARRRNLYNTLVLFGGEIRPYVEKRLKSKEWFAVRQMVSLLGELGDEQSIGAFEEVYKNPDERIKKEVLKSIVKIHSQRSTHILTKALDEENPILKNQAIISLGMLKDPSAIDPLARIATKDKNLETKKEAIKALGFIGDRKAIPYLTKILFRKVWFGKKANEGARSMAAYSLGMIGGPEAYHAVEAASRNSGGELYNACKRILEKREETQ